MKRSSFYMLRQLLVPILGAVLLLGTRIWGAVHGGVSPSLLGMGAVALVLMLLGIVWQERGRLRDSIASAAYCFFVFLSCVFAYLIVANHSMPIDVTAHRIHTLSGQSRAFLHQLDTRIKVVAFAEIQDHAALSDFFDLYRRETDKIDFELYDPTINAGEALQFAEKVYPGDLFVTAYQGGEQLRRQRGILRASDRYRESALSNALLKVVRGRDDRIYFITGKGERSTRPPENLRREAVDVSLSQTVQVLADRVLPIAELNMQGAGKIPGDAGVVVIAGPTLDLFDQEREMLLNYLDEGGSLLVMIDPMMVIGRDLPNLRAVLTHAGMDAQNDIVIDPFARPTNTHTMVQPAGAHPIVEASNETPFMMNIVRPVEDRSDLSPRSALVKPLLATHDKVWVEDAHQLSATMRATQPDDAALIHSQTMALAGTYSTPGGVRGEVARLVLIGDSDAFGNYMVSNEAAVFLLQCVNWLTARQDQLAIPPKLLPVSKLRLTQGRFWIICGGLLLLGLSLLGGGVGYTAARRRMR